MADFGIGVNDIEGPITEDYYGNSLLEIVSDENGMIEVPNMWPQRYDLDVGPPPNSGWIKTNTLEGGHGWDYWLHEGWDGYDNEFVVGNEKFPFAVGGFIKVFSDLPADTQVSSVELTGTISTVSPWPNGINFAEVGALDQVCLPSCCCCCCYCYWWCLFCQYIVAPLTFFNAILLLVECAVLFF